MNASGNSVHIAREMMFGYRDEFRYLECGSCGSLHIIDIPDLSKYYPDDYYSFVDDGESALKAYLKAIRARHNLLRPTLLGALLNRVYGPPNLAWLPYLTVPVNAPILDVGCGRGNMLIYLSSIGFKNLTGIDPNVPENLSYANGVRVIRGEVWDAPRQDYQFILLQYSLEHVIDPIRVIRATRLIVAKDGMVVVRIPIAGTFAWRTYNIDWASLDPPRHLYLFSERAFCSVAEDSGFDVERIIYDSTDFQFWGSEQLRKNIPFNDPRSFNNSPAKSIFSRQDIRTFKRRAAELNSQRDGDLATFFLRPRSRSN
jgi:SAM-dependent methyltransferase